MTMHVPGEPPDARPPSLLGELLRGFDGRSLFAVLLLLGTGSAVGIRWGDLVVAEYVIDGLLFGIWIWMALLIAWRVDPRRDLLMITVGLGGGVTIEWWGTNSGLWAYFTGERPPLWILPAWPAATLAIDRMATFLGLLGERCARAVGRVPSDRAYRLVYFTVVPAFVVWMTWFLWPCGEHVASQVVIVLMVLVAAQTREPRRDVALFLAGSVMGLLLEYWGTSRECWMYYTHQIPPPVAVVAHGFAAVAFSRVAGITERAVRRLGWTMHSVATG
ncbi:MAG: hypothetical protein JW751_21235 [Polyangiaceae bacterium]|nr:hypothetical protein [Polyangiaceae bacterium]